MELVGNEPSCDTLNEMSRRYHRAVRERKVAEISHGFSVKVHRGNTIAKPIRIGDKNQTSLDKPCYLFDACKKRYTRA